MEVYFESRPKNHFVTRNPQATQAGREKGKIARKGINVQRAEGDYQQSTVRKLEKAAVTISVPLRISWIFFLLCLNVPEQIQQLRHLSSHS